MKLREETAAIKFQVEYKMAYGGCTAKITLLIPAVEGIIIEPLQTSSEVSVFGRQLLGNWGEFDSDYRPNYRKHSITVYAECVADLEKEIDNVIATATKTIELVLNDYNSKIEKLPEPREISWKFTYKSLTLMLDS